MLTITGVALLLLVCGVVGWSAGRKRAAAESKAWRESLARPPSVLDKQNVRARKDFAERMRQPTTHRVSRTAPIQAQNSDAVLSASALAALNERTYEGGKWADIPTLAPDVTTPLNNCGASNDNGGDSYSSSDSSSGSSDCGGSSGGDSGSSGGGDL